MKKYLFLALFLSATQAHAHAGQEFTGELVENEVSAIEFCSEIKNADDRCRDSANLVFAALLINDDEAVAVLVDKQKFSELEGKKVKAKFTDFNPVGTIVEVM